MNADDVKDKIVPLKLQIEAIRTQCTHKHADGTDAHELSTFGSRIRCIGCKEEILTPEQIAALDANKL